MNSDAFFAFSAISDLFPQVAVERPGKVLNDASVMTLSHDPRLRSKRWRTPVRSNTNAALRPNAVRVRGAKRASHGAVPVLLFSR
jgi:hypothetical protein